jgi:hypothetical protein
VKQKWHQSQQQHDSTAFVREGRSPGTSAAATATAEHRFHQHCHQYFCSSFNSDRFRLHQRFCSSSSACALVSLRMQEYLRFRSYERATIS